MTMIMESDSLRIGSKNKEINKKLESKDADEVLKSLNLILDIKKDNELDDLTNDLFLILITEFYYRIGYRVEIE